MRQHPTLGSRMINGVSEAVGCLHRQNRARFWTFRTQKSWVQESHKSGLNQRLSMADWSAMVKAEGGWTDGGLV